MTALDGKPARGGAAGGREAERAQGELRAEIDAVLAELSPWKRPARIFFSGQEMPRTATRKVKRDAVKAMLAQAGAEGTAWPLI